MSMFSKDDDDSEDDGPMFGGAERHEARQAKRERAKEIASGLVSGFLERDEEVWEEVKKIEDKG